MATQSWIAARESELVVTIDIIREISEALTIENVGDGQCNPHNRDHWATLRVNALTLATRATALAAEIAKLI